MKHIQVEKAQKNVLAFIQQKKEEFVYGSKFLIELNYYDKNQNLSLTMIFYILGVLLD